MTGVHPYCVVPSGVRPEDGIRGLGGAKVAPVPVGAVDVWASELEARPEADLSALRAHDRVVRAADRDGRTPLPVRFGAWFADRDALVRRIGEREAVYRAALETVAGCLEFGVRVVEPGDGAADREIGTDAGDERGRLAAAGSAGPGTAYLRAVARRRTAERRRRERADRILEELREAVEGRVRDERVEHPDAGRGLLSVAHLVPAAAVRAYRDAVEGLRRTREEIRIVATGPWPPYSFVP